MKRLVVAFLVTTFFFALLFQAVLARSAAGAPGSGPALAPRLQASSSPAAATETSAAAPTVAVTPVVTSTSVATATAVVTATAAVTGTVSAPAATPTPAVPTSVPSSFPWVLIAGGIEAIIIIGLLVFLYRANP